MSTELNPLTAEHWKKVANVARMRYEESESSLERALKENKESRTEIYKLENCLHDAHQQNQSYENMLYKAIDIMTKVVGHPSDKSVIEDIKEFIIIAKS